jgi:dephospho-CoA kinase
MLSVALTGNVGAGKSTVAQLFRRWGATIIDADQQVRELQLPGTPVFGAIVRRFGPAVVRADGTLDRAALRAEVLQDPAALADLNAIVHPAVHRLRNERLREAAARGDRIVISDIPLLFEAADPAAFDLIILVDAPETVRRARLLASRDLTEAEVDRLMRAQQPAGAKRRRSDFIIENGGNLETLEQSARKVWQALLARA